MTKTGWLSLGLVEDALPAFEAGGLRTVEAPLPRPCGPQPPGQHRSGVPPSRRHLRHGAAPAALRQVRQPS